MKAQGYATGAIGKWHLGMQPGYHPMDRGFDEFFGMASGTKYIDRSWPNVHYLDGLLQFDNAQPPGEGESEDPARLARRGLMRGREPAPLEEYVTDQLAKEAVAFIDRHQDGPFFLYVAFNAPHAPLETTDEYYQRFPQFKDERKRIHAAMISALDDGVGRILDRVAASGAADNTIVVFTSDNGGPEVTDSDGRCNAPYLGHKRNLYEGGIRLPFIVRWPARLGAGVTYSEMVSTLDLLPTLLAAAGGADPGDATATARRRRSAAVSLDTGEKKQAAPHESLFWRSGPNGAVRQGRYKLVFGGEVARLYDLEQDPGEKQRPLGEDGRPGRRDAQGVGRVERAAIAGAQLGADRSDRRSTATRSAGTSSRRRLSRTDQRRDQQQPARSPPPGRAGRAARRC